MCGCRCCSEEVQSRAFIGLRTEHRRFVSEPLCLHLWGSIPKSNQHYSTPWSCRELKEGREGTQQYVSTSGEFPGELKCQGLSHKWPRKWGIWLFHGRRPWLCLEQGPSPVFARLSWAEFLNCEFKLSQVFKYGLKPSRVESSRVKSSRTVRKPKFPMVHFLSFLFNLYQPSFVNLI